MHEVSEAMLKKIVLIAPKNAFPQSHIQRIQTLLSKKQVESYFVTESNDIIAHSPDCVIVLSPEIPKLTHFPTYGLMQQPMSIYLELPRYLRNILTYDGYLTICDKTQQSLEDLIFGARKLNTKVARFDFTESSNLSPIANFESIFYFEPNVAKSPYSNALENIQETIPTFKMGTYRWGINRKVSVLKNSEAVLDHYRTAGVGLNLHLSDGENQVISQQLLDIIASGAATIAPYSKFLEKVFGETLWFISPDLDSKAIGNAVKKQLALIQKNPRLAQEKAKKALEIYNEKFAFDTIFKNLEGFHSECLIKKGFTPQKDEKQLPSVTYIIRTGGNNRENLERALNSLINQNYPNIKALFITHASFSYMNEIIANYPSLQIKAIHSEKSIRSKAICLGMAAVDTELFGLLDDDDEIHPNHVRSLVSTLEYNNNLDWRGPIKLAYSGSIIINPNGAYEIEDEFLDLNLAHHSHKRIIEHFRFYKTYKMSHHQWFMMSNSWLAHRSILDEELLTDPGIHTCEDLYFEIQFAQRTHFAFSVEATAYHHFHSHNSTIVDSESHIPDTTRIALRNFSRSFPGEFIYDSRFNPAGLLPRIEEPNYVNQFTIPKLKHCIPGISQIVCTPQYLSGYHTFVREPQPVIVSASEVQIAPKSNRNFSIIFRPFEVFTFFLKLNHIKRTMLIRKARNYYHQHGIIRMMLRMLTYNANEQDSRVKTKVKREINTLFFPLILIKNVKRLLLRLSSKVKG